MKTSYMRNIAFVGLVMALVGRSPVSAEDKKEALSVEVVGFVSKPVRIEVTKDTTAADLLKAAGETKWSSRPRISVIRLGYVGHSETKRLPFTRITSLFGTSLFVIPTP